MAGKYTPGPWEYRQIADTFNTGRPVYGIGPVKNGAVWFVAEQAYLEDARLIAAAPARLSAARNARNVLAALAVGDLKAVRADGPALAELRDAIRKAEGG